MACRFFLSLLAMFRPLAKWGQGIPSPCKRRRSRPQSTSAGSTEILKERPLALALLWLKRFCLMKIIRDCIPSLHLLKSLRHRAVHICLFCSGLLILLRIFITRTSSQSGFTVSNPNPHKINENHQILRSSRCKTQKLAAQSCCSLEICISKWSLWVSKAESTATVKAMFGWDRLG